MSTLRDLGVKRKDMGGPMCAPCCDTSKQAEYDNEIVHPCIEAYGELAKMLPLAKMEPGVVYRTEIELRLKSVSLDEHKGATSGSLAVIAIGDLEPQGGDEPDEPVVKVMKVKGAGYA